ncbi:DUF485 domain-containing protein [Streptomyces lunaelactis]|uniref:DUF485 domain-containing protein n=1 Tax=Streptomyces lunaelactis TaxID=1535768 RepID=UPI0028167210|nr:DUF485 domain-containing protein [Streptomyces lunaelactis]
MSYYPSQPSYPEQPGQPHHSWQEPPPPSTAPPADPRREIRALSDAYRRLRRVASLTALGYFVLFLFLSAYAPGLMTSRITGGLSIALLLGLLQLPVTLMAVAAYERSARRRVDPLAEAVRALSDQSPQGARR